MEFSLYGMATDFCIMSALIFAAQLLRKKVKWLQNYYIPSPLVAGGIGLLLGPQVGGLIPWTTGADSYAYLLTCILFAGIFLGRKGKSRRGENCPQRGGAGGPFPQKTMGGGKFLRFIAQVGDTFFVNTASEILCFGIALSLGGTLLLLLFPGVFPELSLLLPSGFAGGHGYAAAIGGALNELLGREDGVYIGQAFATLGLLTGLLGGLACINYAARRGATRFVKEASLLPEECRTGLLPEEKRMSMGRETIHPMSMDPQTWHTALLLMAFGAGYGVSLLLNKVLPQLNFPLMCLTMLAGLVLQKILDVTGYAEYVDKRVIDRASGCITDYLVAFGVATIRLSVVQEFWQPIIVLCVIGVVWPLVIVFFVGRKLFHNFWFERSIFIFGYLTGIVAVGITLLRSVDPHMKSGTLDDFGFAYTIQSVIEIFLVALIPTAAVTFGCLPAGLALDAVGIILLLASWKLCGSYGGAMNELREGEAEVIREE